MEQQGGAPGQQNQRQQQQPLYDISQGGHYGEFMRVPAAQLLCPPSRPQSALLSRLLLDACETNMLTLLSHRCQCCGTFPSFLFVFPSVKSSGYAPASCLPTSPKPRLNLSSISLLSNVLKKNRKSLDMRYCAKNPHVSCCIAFRHWGETTVTNVCFL